MTKSYKKKKYVTNSYPQVELLGYASGSDHLCLVYEFLQNGSLNDHLHDPLLRGTYLLMPWIPHPHPSLFEHLDNWVCLFFF